MKIHEYQAKELFRQYSIPTPAGVVAFSKEEALKLCENVGPLPRVVKAQIHAGGRGLGGGVKVAKTKEELETYIDQILGMNLVTHQTGPGGQPVKKILIEEGLNISKELYLSLVTDRGSGKVVIMASEAGGMNIEEVAETSPEKIIKTYVDPQGALQSYNCRQIIYGLNLDKQLAREMTALLNNLYRLFIDHDCSLLEINPLVITAENTLIALDAKANFDDNALFRHPSLNDMRDTDEEDPLELEASNYNLNYIKMYGNIGNMVNGAGLAMATMDIIKQAGAEPANFLDVGGGANAEMVENGFRLILSDPNVKGILINIFGGILRCDVLAEGVVEAARKVNLNVPVVVRMEGTNVERGRQILADSGLQLTTAVDLADAAEKISQITL